MAIFEVPQKFAGQTLNQLQKSTGFAFRPDVLGGIAGISENIPLTAGQSITFRDDPGASEFQFLSQFFDPAGTQQAAESAEFAAGQKAEEESFLTALTERVAGQETLTAGAERIGGELGLPALRQSAFDLTQTLKGIPQTQETISKQVGISAPNLQRRIAAEQGKIAPLAQEAVSQQQFGEQELGQRLGFLLADQAKELEPFYRAQLPLLSDRLAREQASYDLEKQRELDLLLENISNRATASQAELDRANELALAELEYKNVQLDTEIITVGGRRKLVNRQTGEVIADLGSSTAPSTPIDPNKYIDKNNKPTLQELEGTA